MSFRGAAPACPDVAALVLLKCAVSAVVLGTGFHAISDDDFARVVIAQRFAESPSLDPSGTSWLPLPFWIYGGTFRLLGPSLTVARGTAIALGVASVLGVWWAARCLKIGRWGALSGAAIAAIFPYSAYLGAATVPEAFSAALCVLGAASLCGNVRQRLLGSVALALACASRYEPWAVAAAFALVSVAQAVRKRDIRLAATALPACLSPAAWLLLGSSVHGDALFFVSRVAGYQAALGVLPGVGALLRVPFSLVSAEPELFAVFSSLLLVLATRAGSVSLGISGLRVFLGVLSSILLLLAAAALRGSAPTHHGERALLPLWFATAILLGRAIELVLERPFRRRTQALLATAAAGLAASLLIRPLLAREAFTNRSAELELGEQARRRALVGLAIDAPDYGFFAVQAAYTRPGATRVLDDRDPRKPRALDLLLDNPKALAQTLKAEGFPWLAVRKPRARLSRGIGRQHAINDDWVLVELAAAPPDPILQR